MIRVAICDNDLPIAQKIKVDVSKILDKCHEIYDIELFQAGEQLLVYEHFDIVILDIEMGELNGIETAKLLRKQHISSNIIFITSYKKYVFLAFDVEATHYLLKPVNVAKLEEVLCRVIKKLEKKNVLGITVKNGSNMHFVTFSEINYAEIYGRKITLHTTKNIYTLNGRLEELEQCLPDDFFRCHKSYIINLAKVTVYESETATITTGETVPIARRKYSAFGKAFLSFLREREV